MNHFRFKKRVINDEKQILEVADEDYVSQLHEILDKPLEKKLLQKALLTLPLKQREALSLKYFDEKSYEEIAEIMRIPVGTVGTLIARAKQVLKNKIGDKI